MHDDDSLRVFDLACLDLETLGSVLAGSDWLAGCFDPVTGDVIQAFNGEVLAENGNPIDLDEGAWVVIEGEGSRPSYRDMEIFVDSVGDPVLAGRLRQALEGRGAFSRFRHEIHLAAEPMRNAWFEFRDASQQIRAIGWLTTRHYVDQSAGVVAVAGLEERCDYALAQAAGAPGARLDAVDLPARWADVIGLLDRGETVVLTRDDHPWANISPVE